MRHLSLSPSTSYSLFHFISLFLRAYFQKLPRQFTVTLHHFSLFFLCLFFIHLSAFPLSIKYTWAFAPPLAVFLSFLSLSNISPCFPPLQSRHFILTFQNRGALSLGKKCLNCTQHVGLIHLLQSQCAFFLPLLKNVCRPFISLSILMPWGILQNHPIYIAYIQLSSLCCVSVIVFMCVNALTQYFSIVHVWTGINNELCLDYSHHYLQHDM